jgi:hypothetical protein
MNKIIVTLLVCCSLSTTAQTLKDCSACATQIIRPEQVKDLSIDEIRFLINDLFAWKGYKFKSGDVSSYYAGMSWYKPVTDNDKIVYNDIEKQNTKLFQDKISAIKKDRENLIAELRSLKSALLTNDKSGLSEKYGYTTTDKDYGKQYAYLKDVFTKINLDDIHWSFDVGMYKLTVDNGDIVMDYEIQINPYGFIIKYGNQGGSAIGKQIYPADPIEFTFLWEFDWKNNQIKYSKMVVAG